MSRQYTKAELEYAAGIIALTAERNNTSPEEVRLRLKEAIIACYFNADP